MNEGMGGGEAPFRVQFKSPPSLSQPNMPVLQLREVSFRWPGRETVPLSRSDRLRKILAKTASLWLQRRRICGLT